ncbi:hypothetical protein ACQ4PT_067042 [Festuca glaucescens]
MESPSARGRRSPPPANGASSGRLPPSSDRISALADDMILLILSRLGSVRAAARTGVLSRRWLGLWTRLADLAFRADAADKIEAALACFSAAASPVAYSIRISFPVTLPREPSRLLRAAALLSPAELVLVLKEEPRQAYGAAVALPCFHRATSIEIDAGLHRLRPPPAGEFPAALLSPATSPASAPCSAAARACECSLSPFAVSIPIDAARFHRLLCTAARLSAQKLVFTHEFGRDTEAAHLPCFHRATSIELDVGLLRISPPPSGDFPLLEKLSIAGNIVDLGTLLGRCPRLRVLGVVFRGVLHLRALKAALAALEAAAAALGLTLSLGVDSRSTHNFDARGFDDLLRAMARISVQKLVFTHHFGSRIEANLPCFQRAMSIEMDLKNVCFTALLDGEFSALERLSISEGCSIVDLSTLLSRCPCLRVLKVAMATGDVTVHSASVQDLHVHSNTECHNIDIVTPMLKKLELEVSAGSGRELSVSISAPMVEKVSWKRRYTTSAVMFGFWRLKCASLESGQELDTCDPRVHALCLHISCIVSGRLGSRPILAKEMEKLLITNFSVLDLRLCTCGHIFGALVLRILGMERIRAATEKLKIVILPSCPPVIFPHV